MIEFNRDQLEMFLGVVRKYMQVRGNLSQKDLSDLIGIGVSTISRFINQKTKDIDAGLIARIVAGLNIPLHEIIDFVKEESEENFKKMIKFYKDIKDSDKGEEYKEDVPFEDGDSDQDDEYEDALGDVLGVPRGTAKGNVKANIKIGGKKRTIPFSTEGRDTKDQRLKERLKSLSPRQKAYLSDFLNLDMEGRDLLVDVGNSLFRYFRQKGYEIEF